MHISSASAHAIVKTQTSTTDESRGDDSFVRTVEFGRLGSERERERKLRSYRDTRLARKFSDTCIEDVMS